METTEIFGRESDSEILTAINVTAPAAPVQQRSPKDRDAWGSIYRRKTLIGLLYRERMQTVLDMVARAVSPARPAKMLEVGCAAGYLTTALARRGYSIVAVDPVESMVAATRARVRGERLDSLVNVCRAEAYNLELPNAGFDAAIALGILSWLRDPSFALAEISRVLKPGGFFISLAENRYQLVHLADPVLNPLLQPINELCRRGLNRLRGRRTRFQPELPMAYSPAAVQTMLSEVGLTIREERTVGFGPFTFGGKHVVPDTAGMIIHRTLQSLADRSFPGLEKMGSQYIVCSIKTG